MLRKTCQGCPFAIMENSLHLGRASMAWKNDHQDHLEAPGFDFLVRLAMCYTTRQPSVNGTAPEQSWDYQARSEAPKNILKDYSMPLLSSHPVYRQECRSVHRKSDSKPICLHANK